MGVGAVHAAVVGWWKEWAFASQKVVEVQGFPRERIVALAAGEGSPVTWTSTAVAAAAAAADSDDWGLVVLYCIAALKGLIGMALVVVAWEDHADAAKVTLLPIAAVVVAVAVVVSVAAADLEKAMNLVAHWSPAELVGTHYVPVIASHQQLLSAGQN